MRLRPEGRSTPQTALESERSAEVKSALVDALEARSASGRRQAGRRSRQGDFAASTSPCLGYVDVSPWRIRVEFSDCHYITVSSPVGGSGGFSSVSFSAFRTRRASGQPPLTPATLRLILQAQASPGVSYSAPPSPAPRKNQRLLPRADDPRAVASAARVQLRRYELSLAARSDDRSAASPARP